jgi:hypothetical protein
VDTARIAQPHREDHDHQDERSHACKDGWIKLGQIAVDLETPRGGRSFLLRSPAPERSSTSRIEEGVRAGRNVGDDFGGAGHQDLKAKIAAYTYAFLVNRMLGRLQGRIKELWA